MLKTNIKLIAQNKDFVTLLCGRGLQALLAMLSIRAMTSMLDKQNVGLNYVVLGVVSYFGLILINPLGMYVNRHLHEWYDGGVLQSVLKKINIYFLLIALMSAPFVYLGSADLGIGAGISTGNFMFLIVLYIYIGTWFNTLGPLLNMLEHRSIFVATNLISSALGLLISILLVRFVSATIFNWLIGILCGQLIANFISWFYFKKKILHSMAQATKEIQLFNKGLLYFCLPIAITTVFMWAQNHSYKLIIESYLGVQLLANLGVGLGIAASLSGVVESLVSQYFHPQYYAAISVAEKSARTEAWHILYKNAISVYIPFAILFICAAKYIFGFLVSNSFNGVYTVLMWGASIEFFRMLGNIFYIISQSEKNTKSTIAPYVLGGSSVVILMWALIYFNIENQESLIPALLSLSGFFTCFAMYLSMKNILDININISFIIRCVLLSLPLFFVFSVYQWELHWYFRLMICGLLGLYTLFVVWRLQMFLHPTNIADDNFTKS